MKKKWVALWMAGAFLLGVLGTYSAVEWILPMEEKAAPERTLETEEIEGFDKVAQAYHLIRSSYVEKTENGQLIHGAIQGMISTLKDPYSVYMDAETSKRFNENFETSFEGIGAQIAIEEGKLIIVSPIKNTPAEKAGLKPRDQILKIDGKSVEGLDVNQASERIRGEKGSEVELEIKRGASSVPFTVNIQRADVPLLTVFSDMKKSGKKNVGYIEITSFSTETARDFANELSDLEKKGIDGLIIDVRGNPGGMLSSVEDILQQLVTGKKPYVQIEEKSGKKQPYFSSLKKRKPYPVALLVNEGSASASEILAGGLKEIEDYPLVGEKTFGKGTVQQPVPLDDGSNIKLTMFKWLTPEGNWIHGKGIEPTFEVKQPALFDVQAIRPSETLVRDMNNDQVKTAQEALAALGFSPGRKDGYFDENTEIAVKAFQSVQKLPVTGKIDEATAGGLEEQVRTRIEDEKYDLQLQVALKII